MFFKKNVFTFLFVGMLATKVYAQELPSMDSNILYGKLENGLTYYIKKNTTPKNKLALNLVVKAGSLMETDKQLGLAHLLEHMAFNGSKNFPKNSIDDYFNSIGLSLGSHFNASTGFETTNYRFEIPTNQTGVVENGIHILSDMASNLDLSDEAFDRERKIIEEEWRGGLGIRDRHFQQVGKLLLNNSRYFYRKPIGNIKTIRTFAYEEVRKFYNDWYQPSSMGIFAVGDIEPKEIEAFIKTYFSPIANTKKVTFPSHSIPDFKKNQFTVFRDKKKDYLSFSIYEKRDYIQINSYENHRVHLIQELALLILRKRFHELVNKKNTIVLESGFTPVKITRDSYYNLVYAILDDDYILEGIEELITSIESAKKFGFTQQELDQVTKEVLTHYQQSVKEYSTISSKKHINEYIRNFTENEMIVGSEAMYLLVKETLPTISLEDLNRSYKEALNGKNRIIEITAPERIKNLPSEEDVEKIFSKVRAKELVQTSFKINTKKFITKELKGSEVLKKEYFSRLGLTKLELSNGATVYLKPTKFKKDSFLFKARSPGGYSKANTKQLYSAKYLDEILEESDLGEFSITDLSNIIPYAHMNVVPMIGSEFEGLDGSAISQYQEELFQFIYLNFTDRRITESTLDNYKKKELERWENEKELPAYTLRKDFFKAFYEEHPRRFFKTGEILNQINLKDLQEIYQDRFGDVSNFSFIFVGDFDVLEFEDYAKKYIGSLPATFQKESFDDHGIRLNKKKVFVEFKEDNAVKSHQSRYYSRNFVNNPKNRQMCSILMDVLRELLKDEIREKDNLVYSISSNLVDISKYPEEVFTLSISYESNPKNVELINQKIDKVLEKISKGDLDLQVFKEKKLGLVERYKYNLNKNYYWTYAINEYLQNKEPIDNILDIENSINTITVQEVIDLAKKIFNENYLTRSYYSQG